MKSTLSWIGSHVQSISPLPELLRQGARKMLSAAIEAEIEAYVQDRRSFVDEAGRQLVVRNGHQAPRKFVTGIGEIEVVRPRVLDRRIGEDREHFQSKILPPYLRRTKELSELIPWLYLRGVSTNDFSEAFSALTGQSIGGVSEATVCRLKEQWMKEFAQWSSESLRGKRYVYMWADGVYFNIRLNEGRQCMLVIIGVLEDGTKELLAVSDGERESEISWAEVLVSLQKRGLEFAPKLGIADGALGFWAALEKVFPSTVGQRCWVHKAANILNKLPRKAQDKAKEHLHQIWMAERREDAVQEYNTFVNLYQAKYPKAVECLSNDIVSLLAFYSFPAEHWAHIRTTNPIESCFATVRLRTKRTKGCGSADATLMMVFKLAESAQRRWRKLRGFRLLEDVANDVTFEDGIKKAA